MTTSSEMGRRGRARRSRSGRGGAIERLTTLENHRPLTGDPMEVVAILAVRTNATRRDIDSLSNGQESEAVVRGLIRRGLVASEEDPVDGGRHLYRLTARGVAVAGHSSIESLQAHVLAIPIGPGAMSPARQDATGWPHGPLSTGELRALGPASADRVRARSHRA